MQKKDAVSIERVLDVLDRKIPPGKLPPSEKLLITEAKTLQQKLDQQKRTGQVLLI